MKKFVINMLHVAYWISHITIVILILGILYNGKEDGEKITVFWDEYFWFVFIPSILSFYSFYFFLFPTYVKKKRVAHSIVGALLICFVCSGITHLMIPPANVERPEDLNSANIILSFLIVGVITFGNGVAALILHGFVNWANEIKWKEDLMKKNHEMEMASVRAQLDPHFLFNTINNIDALILKRPEVASDYLNRLADMMRYMFYSSHSNRITLAEEVEYLNKYVALQNLRRVTSNYATLSVSGTIQDKSLAPMVLIPFVDNAFKHAPDKEEESAIEIDLEISESHLRFTCVNKYEVNKNSVKSFGVGNDLIERRLQLLYSSTHKLEIKKERNRYLVTLMVEFDANFCH